MGDDNEQKESSTANTVSMNRHTAWWALTVFSAICVASQFSALSDKKDAGGTVTRDDKWTGSVMIVSMCLGFLACLASTYLTERFVGQWSESVTSTVLLALWAAAMPSIMDPDNFQAVDERGEIFNANLYFFSWASLVAVIWIFCNDTTISKYLKRGDDSGTPPNMTKWYMFVAASVVVMTSSIRLYKADNNQCNDGDSSSFCQRVKYALSLGAIGVVFGIVEILLSNMGMLSTYPEAGLTFVLFALFVVGIAVITFGGQKGPATNIGNLYFSTWIGFVLAMFLVSESWTAVRAKMKGEDAEEAEDAKAEEGEASDDKKVEDAPPEAPLDVTSGDD
jgi:hypothetical protein